MKQTIKTSLTGDEGLKRDYAVDNLKGVLIALVILGHGNLLTSFKTPLGNFLQGFIYLFHMPLFFGLSALFIKNFSWQYVIKRFLQLMVPFYFFVIIDPVNVIYQLIHPGMSALPLLFGLSVKEVVRKVFIGSGIYLQSPLWFLPTLFLSNILFSVLYKYRFIKPVIIIYSLVFFLVLFFAYSLQPIHFRIPYGIDIAIYITPLLFLLHYIYQNKKRYLSYNPFIYIAGIIGACFLIVYLIPKNPVTELSGRFDLAQFYVPNTIWGYLLICLLSVLIFLFFLKFNKASLFSKIGYYTMPIFILHVYPWFSGLKYLGPALFLPISVIGNIIIGIIISKSLMKISPKFSWVGMVA